MTRKDHEAASKAHDKAAQKALNKGKTPREAAIAGMVAEIMFHQGRAR